MSYPNLTVVQKLDALGNLLEEHERAGAQIMSTFATHLITDYKFFVHKKGYKLTAGQSALVDSMYQEYIIGAGRK